MTDGQWPMTKESQKIGHRSSAIGHPGANGPKYRMSIPK